jgi:hypothetical protein
MNPETMLNTKTSARFMKTVYPSKTGVSSDEFTAEPVNVVSHPVNEETVNE